MKVMIFNPTLTNKSMSGTEHRHYHNMVMRTKKVWMSMIRNQMAKTNIIMVNLGLKLSLKQIKKCHNIHLKQLLQSSHIWTKTFKLRVKVIIVFLMILLKLTTKLLLLPLEKWSKIPILEMMGNHLQRDLLSVILMLSNALI